MERYRTTLLMAAILLILVGVAFFLTGKNVSSPGTPTPVPTVYVYEEPNPVNAIQVVSGTNRVSLVKDVVVGSWSLTEPVQKPADLFQVSGVADNLQKLQASYTLTATGDLAQYGLAGNSMQVTATFSDTQGTKRTFNVGNATPEGSGYYVKLPDRETIYVVQNFTIEPMRTWLTSPPVEPPTPTPVPFTPIPPTPTATATASSSTVVTGTVPSSVSPAVPTATPTISP
jgi:Domain of unknown function (DUF4340)